MLRLHDPTWLAQNDTRVSDPFFVHWIGLDDSDTCPPRRQVDFENGPETGMGRT